MACFVRVLIKLIPLPTSGVTVTIFNSSLFECDSVTAARVSGNAVIQMIKWSLTFRLKLALAMAPGCVHWLTGSEGSGIWLKCNDHFVGNILLLNFASLAEKKRQMAVSHEIAWLTASTGGWFRTGPPERQGGGSAATASETTATEMGQLNPELNEVKAGESQERTR
ncbi:hypothetical protein K439DRAFT_1622928 [Ramaria rubella]|nr:hypothetical protein K439DRAFT_1622928 [Ramaria rubella]